MVATAKARKTLVNTDGGYYTSHYHHQQHQTPRNNTNRRNIVGLSEAIREKAFQSTSPSSEATNGNSSSNFRSNYETAVAMRRDQERSTRKQPLTVEERLRKLLHSEAESTDAESYIENKFSNSYNSKKTSKMPLRLRSKTPNPHVSNTYSSATLNRSTNYRQQMESFNEEQTTMASSHHNTTQPNHQQVRSQYFHTSQRRCKSAVPAAFHDHEWNNKISDKPATNPPANHHHHHHQSSAHHHQHQQQQQHVNNSNKTCKSEQNLSKNQQQRNFPMTSYQIVGRAPPGGGKPVPAVRRSLHADSGFDSSRSTTNNNHEQQHQQQTHSNNNKKQQQQQQQQQRNTYVIKSQLSLANQYDDVTIAVHPPPYGSVQHITNEPTTTTRQGPHHHEPRRCMTPAPDKRRATHRQRGDQSPVAVTSSRHATPTSSRKSKESGKSAQQNISFRRAIRATSSEDENLHASSQQQQQPRGSAAPPHVVKRMTSSGQTSLSSCATTKATGKSDDRDSGAVLHETPESVFDFESSVCSELDPQQQQRRHHQRTDVIVSRSDTPLLPPLDDDVITEEEEMEDKMKRSHHHHQHPEVYSGSNAATTVNNLTVVAGYKVPTLPQKKKEDHFSAASNNQSIRDNDAVSNLIDFVKIEERKQQQRARYRGGAGGDEKDNEAETKLQQQQQQQQQQAPSNCNCSSQKNSQEHAGSRGAGGAFNPLQDLYDSESIFSLTTASVCSSAIRGRGKRHRHGSSSKRGGGGQGKGDKYAKEIRSINKRFSRLETHVVSLARTLAQLGNDIRHQAVSAHQIDQLRNEVKELRTRQESMEQQQQQQQTPHKATSKKSSKESSKPKMNKFTKFFSEPQQPSLLNLFLKRLGYEKYLKNFQQQSIGMSELPYMEEKQLEAIGIPLGPRSRILTEARKSSFV